MLDLAREAVTPTAPPRHLPVWPSAVRRRLGPSVRWATVAAGIAIGVGVGIGGTEWVSRLVSGDPPAGQGAPISQAVSPVQQPGELGNDGAAPTATFDVHAAFFPDEAGAAQTAAMLRDFGYRADIGAETAEGVPVVVGPFSTFETTRLVEDELRSRLHFSDVTTVAVPAR